MLIFSSLEAAIREGFKAIDFDKEQGYHIVEKDFPRMPLKVKMLALASRKRTERAS